MHVPSYLVLPQISRWFVVLASSGGASGGGGGGPSGSGPGEWSGASGGSSGGGSMDGGGDRGMDGGACASAVVVKRALLADITRLCVFFGFENTLDSILPQLITFLNDRYIFLSRSRLGNCRLCFVASHFTI